MRMYNKQSDKRMLVNSAKEERWTYIYMVLVAIGFWTLCWVVLR